jgi:hypothetical protein
MKATSNAARRDASAATVIELFLIGSLGRSSGVAVWISQTPCRSGRPSGVRGAVHDGAGGDVAGLDDCAAMVAGSARTSTESGRYR